MSLLNPGTLTEYEGGPSRSSRRSRGTVRVRDPAHGFFVAGSSLDDLNGIYGRVRPDHVRFLSVRRPMRLVYRHDKTGWLMVLVDVDPEELEEQMGAGEEEVDWTRGYEQPCDMQWRFIDDRGNDRFRHKGDTIIPGAGTRWKHMARPKMDAAAAGAEKKKKKKSDDDDDDDSSDSSDDDDDSDDGAENGAEPMSLEDVKLDDDDDDDDDEGGGATTSNEKSSSSGGSNGGALVDTSKHKDEPPEDDEDELPWQVIALLDKSVLDDLRFSSSCRDERVERALRGLDVEQPPESTIEGFLEAERRKMGAITDGGGDGDGSDDAGEAPKGWLYRVTSEGGVKLWNAPSDGNGSNDGDDNDNDDSNDDEDVGVEGVISNVPPQRRTVGKRSDGAYVRIVKIRGPWLRLSPTERPLHDPPLTVGDTVTVILGHYRGNDGTISRALDPETREFGVQLVGYTGTGSLHISALRRVGPVPGSREARRAARAKKVEDERAKRAERRRRREAREREKAIMRQYYGEAYAEFMPHYLEEDDDGDDDDGGGNDTDDEAERLAGRLFGGGGGGSASADDEGDDDEEEDYDHSYDGPLWVATTAEAGTTTKRRHCGKREAAPPPLLVRVSAEDLASLTTGVERDGADLYDRPFEPRIEAGAGESSHGDEVGDMDDEDGLDAAAVGGGGIEEADSEQMTDVPSPLLVATGFVAQRCDEGTEEDESGGSFPPVGTFVLLHGLKNAERYNGRCGTVISKRNAEGRCGVRLDPLDIGDNGKEKAAECGDKRLLLKIENISAVDSVDNASPASSQLSGEEKNSVLRAARVLNVRLDAVGLGNTHVDAVTSRQVLDAMLRAADRDSHPHQLTNTTASTQRMMSDALEEAIRAHATLVRVVEKTAGDATTGDNFSASFGMAPHVAVHGGFLGERAKSALAAASDTSNFERVEHGLASLKVLLADEQARILRAQAEGGLVRSTNPTWKLEKAEKDAASLIGNGSHDFLADDCLRIRLAIVHALFNSQKDTETVAAAEIASKLYPSSPAAHLWHGRCLLRKGLRTEGMKCLDNCVILGPKVGPGGAWAHGEGAKRLRSLRKTLKCEFRAKDSYERGNFAVAAKIYGEMMEEYDSYASDDKWGRAEALIARAACHRRDRDLKSALVDCDLALKIFPRYPRALFRRALCLLESQRPKDALSAFEQLLRVDRKWPKLLDWLVRAVAQARRLESNNGGERNAGESFDENGGASSCQEDYYAVLGVSTDATEAQLKRAYRLMSLKVHPDKKGGSSAAFHLVADAYETLSDPEKRQLYDDGVDVSKKKRKKERGPYDSSSSESEDEDGNKKKSLREEVERKYFPENFKFWPFGDPFINKRRHQARKRKQAEQEKARKARMNGGQRPHSWWDRHDDWDL